MSRNCKICCGVTAIFLVTIVVLFTILAFTVFKPKDPNITARPFGLNNITFSFQNSTQNVTIGMHITIGNQNYGSFSFRNSTADVTCNGELIGEIPIQGELVPAHSKIDINTSAVIFVDKLLSDPVVWQEFFGGGNLTFTSVATLPGRVNMLNIVKLHAEVFSQCDMSIIVASGEVVSTCNSKIKM